MPGRYLPLNDGQTHTLDSFWYAIVPAIEEDYIIVIVEVLDDGAWRDTIGRSRYCAVAIREHAAVNDAFTKWFAPVPAAFKRSSSSSSCVTTAKKQPDKKRKVVAIHTPVKVPPPAPAESSSATSSDSEPHQPVSLLANLLNKN